MKTIKPFIIVLLALCAAVTCGAQVDYKTGSYINVHQLFNDTDEKLLQNPSHHMTEGVFLDQSKIMNTFSGFNMSDGSVNYYTSFDYIPVPKRLVNATTLGLVDYAYRGMIILFGEEYYVKEVAYPGFISAYKGMILDQVGNNSFTYYGGYGFRTDEKIFDCNDVAMVCWPVGANISVRKPNGQTLSNITVKNYADATIDNLIISVNEVNNVPYDKPTELVSSLLIYNKSTEAILENGYPLELKGISQTNWMVSISAQKRPFDAGMDIVEYSNIAADQYLLKNATIRYTTPVIINRSNYLALPAAYKVIFNGTYVEVVDINSTTTTTTTTTSTTTTRTTTTTTSSTTTTLTNCTLKGDFPPCGQISLGEVISLINAWAAGTANLSEVITLINAWAAG